MTQFVVGVIQASMAGWVGVRSYRMVSASRDDSYAHIANIPLVPGRSALSDALCSSWIDTYRSIPQEFWWREDKKKDERAWNAIRMFAIHCLQRREYEKQVKQEMGVCEDVEHVALPLPVDQVVKMEDVLTKEEVNVNELVRDRED